MTWEEKDVTLVTEVRWPLPFGSHSHRAYRRCSYEMTSWLASLLELGEGEHLPCGVALQGPLLSNVHTTQQTHPNATVTQWSHPTHQLSRASVKQEVSDSWVQILIKPEIRPCGAPDVDGAPLLLMVSITHQERQASSLRTLFMEELRKGL